MMSITVKLLTLIQSVGLTSPGLGGVVLYLGGRASLPRGSWHLSSPTRDGTPVSGLGRQILNHGTTQKGHMLPQLCFCTHVVSCLYGFIPCAGSCLHNHSCSSTRSFILFIHNYIFLPIYPGLNPRKQLTALHFQNCVILQVTQKESYRMRSLGLPFLTQRDSLPCVHSFFLPIAGWHSKALMSHSLSSLQFSC